MDLFEMLVDLPAWALGQILGMLLHLGAMIGCLAAAICAGVVVYRLVRLPLFNWFASIVVGCWVLLVLYRAETWAAAAWIHAAEMRDTNDY